MIAIPVAAGVAIGAAVIAVHGGPINVADSSFSRHHQGPSASPTTSASGTASASATASARPSTSTSTGTGATVAPANSFAGGAVATAQLGDVATRPVDGTGAAINTRQTAAQAATSMNCSLSVPANPLSAVGLATPWQLGDGCSMANAGTEGAFVEATILAPSGQLSVYSPLVVTAGTQPAVTPVAPAIAAGSVVEISVGFNGTNLYLTGAGAVRGKCVGRAPPRPRRPPRSPPRRTLGPARRLARSPRAAAGTDPSTRPACNLVGQLPPSRHAANIPRAWPAPASLGPARRASFLLAPYAPPDLQEECLPLLKEAVARGADKGTAGLLPLLTRAPNQAVAALSLAERPGHHTYSILCRRVGGSLTVP